MLASASLLPNGITALCMKCRQMRAVSLIRRRETPELFFSMKLDQSFRADGGSIVVLVDRILDRLDHLHIQ